MNISSVRAERVPQDVSPATSHFSPAGLPLRTIVIVTSSLRPRATPFHSSLPYLELSVSASKAMVSPAGAAV
jgi:hypothetical protein